MGFNLTALFELLTPVSEDEARMISAADMVANAHRYPPPSDRAIVLESPIDDDPEIPAT
jgi:hypothetical protein